MRYGTEPGAVLTLAAVSLICVACPVPRADPVADLARRTWGLSDCPSGTCDPGNGNGRGIYVVEGSIYCLKIYEDNWVTGKYDFFFCPETFVKSNGVMLQGSVWVQQVVDTNTLKTIYFKDSVRLPVRASLHGNPIELTEIESEESHLVVQFAPDAGVTSSVKDDDLENLRLAMTAPYDTVGGKQLGQDLEMSIMPEASDGGVYWYQVAFNTVGGTRTDLQYCQGGSNVLSPDKTWVVFIPQLQIDAIKAEVTRSDSSQVTMACRSGGIGTCVSWGYKPWDIQDHTKTPAVPVDPGASDNLFGACMQAKRAAYFASQNNYNSYTKTGTTIQRRDIYGIIADDDLSSLEAIWGPDGAHCLNTNNLRHPELVDQSTLQKYQLKSCSSSPDAGQGAIMWEQGIFATGYKH